MDALNAVEQRGFDPCKIPVVEFLGEEGVDTGRIRREPWRLIARNAQGPLFCGKRDRYRPVHSVNHLQVHVTVVIILPTIYMDTIYVVREL
jgi:hypothetical protein